METPQRFVRHDVGRCGRGIARDDQPVPDECLTEEAHDNDDQVQHAADSCVKLWRCFNGAICHFCFYFTTLAHPGSDCSRNAARSSYVRYGEAVLLYAFVNEARNSQKTIQYN